MKLGLTTTSRIVPPVIAAPAPTPDAGAREEEHAPPVRPLLAVQVAARPGASELGLARVEASAEADEARSADACVAAPLSTVRPRARTKPAKREAAPSKKARPTVHRARASAPRSKGRSTKRGS